MILEHPTLAELQQAEADVVIIGSGPVGLATALGLVKRGLRVLVLESGGKAARSATTELSHAENLRPDNHFEPHTAVGRQLGGTSNLWGGRCVPFDPIDFSERPWLGVPAWPIGPEALTWDPLESTCRHASLSIL